MNETTATFTVRITSAEGKPLGPREFDVRELKHVIEMVEDLLLPEGERPFMSLEIKEGSVALAFNMDAGHIREAERGLETMHKSQSLDRLSSKKARSITRFQNYAISKKLEFRIRTQSESTVLDITPDTDYRIRRRDWIITELYLFGRVEKISGSTDPHIILLTEEYGKVQIETTKGYLSNLKDNILYRQFNVHVTAKINLETDELKKGSLKLLGMREYNSNYDPEYLARLREQAKPYLKDLNIDEFLNELRGHDEAFGS